MAKKRGRFVYKKRTKEQLRKRQQQSGGSFDAIFKDDLPTFNPKEGDHAVRFLPPAWDDAEHYGIDLWVHYGIGADSQSYLCAQKMRGDPCPICEEREKAQQEGDDEYAKKLAAKKRVAAWIIDRDKEDNGPVIWSMPYSVDKDITLRCEDKRTGEVLPIDDPEEGYDVEFVREGSKLKTKYTAVEIARTSTPLSDDEDEQEQWLQFIEDHCLPECLNFYNYEYIAGVFKGGKRVQDDDEEEEEDDPKPRRRRSRADDEDEKPRRRGRRSLDEDEDEEGEEEEKPKRSRRRSREEDEEEEEKPKRSRRSRDKDEEEPEEEEEEPPFDPDEGEEEKPKRSRRRGKDDEDESEDDDGEEEEEEEDRGSRVRRNLRGMRGRRGRR